MKVACTHCETVCEEHAVFNWLRVEPYGPVAGPRIDGVFCGPGCVVSHMERVMGRPSLQVGPR